MARPLYIYTDGIPEEGSLVNDYLRYILGEEGQAIVPDVGYVKLQLVSQALIDEQLALL
jgi:ABC-type phosphate transport system substrate-binding protein